MLDEVLSADCVMVSDAELEAVAAPVVMLLDGAAVFEPEAVLAPVFDPPAPPVLVALPSAEAAEVSVPAAEALPGVAEAEPEPPWAEPLLLPEAELAWTTTLPAAL